MVEFSKDDIIDLKKYSNSKLSFKVVNTGHYSKRIDVSYDGIQNPLIVFPKARVTHMTHNSKNNYDITVVIDAEQVFNHHKFIQLWDIAIKRKVKSITPTIETQFSHYFMDRIVKDYRKKFIYITFKTTQNTKYFNRNMKEVSHHNISINDTIICAAYTKGIFMDGDGANQKWTAHQIVGITNNLNIISKDNKQQN